MDKRPFPTDEQIRNWLTADKVTQWVEKKASRYNPEWEELLGYLIRKIQIDKYNDWYVCNSKYPRVTVGVNALNWTLWVAIKYEDGAILAPDCPYRLQDHYKDEELSFVEV